MSRSRLPQRLDTRPFLRVIAEECDAVILPFPLRKRLSLRVAVSPRQSPAMACGVDAARDPISRARVLHDNRRCPSCRRGGVLPIDRGDGDQRYRAMPVPGTSTIVGFQCDSCGMHWSV